MVGVQRRSIVLVRPNSLNPSPVRIRANAKEFSCVPDENFPRLSIERQKPLLCDGFRSDKLAVCSGKADAGYGACVR